MIFYFALNMRDYSYFLQYYPRLFIHLQVLMANHKKIGFYFWYESNHDLYSLRYETSLDYYFSFNLSQLTHYLYPLCFIRFPLDRNIILLVYTGDLLFHHGLYSC